MEFTRSFAHRLSQPQCSAGSRRARLGSMIAASAILMMFQAAAAFARGFDYGAPQRTLHAGIISDYGAGISTSSHILWPSVFYQLSSHTDAKPVGWSIDNPLAPREADADVINRWGTSYTSGQPITPNMAPYWEVPLQSTSASELKNFQILLLELDASDPGIQAPDIEKLRQFVDAGGVLWIDCDNAISLSSFAGWFSVASAGIGVSNRNSVAGGPSLAPGIPAISSPYDLTLGRIFDYMSGGFYTFGADPFLGEYAGDYTDSNAGTRTVAVGHLGAGCVVYSNTGSAAAINAFGMTLTSLDIAVLQFVADIASRANDTFTALQNRQPAGSPGDAFGTSVMPTWRYVATSAASSNAVASAYGRFAYVLDPNNNQLHWFVLSPKGNQASNEFTQNDGYAPVAVGSGLLSPPTVWPGYTGLDTAASAPYSYGGVNGFTNVFVEDATGKVNWVDMKTGNKNSLGLTFAGGGSSGSSSASFTTTPPAPYIYDHRVYGTEPNGQLFVYDLLPGYSASSGGTYLALPTGVGSGLAELGMGGPVVGIVHDDCNNIVAAYSTNRGLYTVFTGARGERLADAGFDPSGNRMYAPKLTGSAPMNPTNTSGKIDPNANSYRVYVIQQDGAKKLLTPSLDAAHQHFIISTAGSTPLDTDPGSGEVYADYDVDWKPADYLPLPVTSVDNAFDRMMVGCANSTITQGSGAVMLSSPVMDRNGNLYFIDNVNSSNSSIICLRDAYPQPSAKLLWRYRLPNTADYSWFVNQAGASNCTTGLADADGHDYSKLGGGLPGEQYSFVGTPVIDSRGNVYAAAVSTGGHSAIFCFNTGTQISASVLPGSIGINPSVQIIQQSGGANQDEYGTTPQLLIPTTNYTANSSGKIVFNNFGQPSGNILYPLFSEGEPVQIQYTFANGQGTNSPPPNVPLHTNIVWCADLSGTQSTLPSGVNNTPIGTVGGLAVVGDYLYFTSSTNGHLYRLYTRGTPNSSGYLDMGGVNGLKKQILQDLGDSSVEPVDALSPGVPSTGDVSVSNGTVLVSGHGGVMNYQPKMTLVADRSRLLGLDSDGDAMFAVDSTDEVQATYTDPNNSAVTDTSSTHVPLNRPTDITQLSTDRYLLVDRGNNRCVEIDRSGNILWELSKFVDKFGLLSPGDPLILSDPSSVQVWRDDYNNVHYLIADSGNYRVVDVVDTYASGTTTPTHLLDWVSQTGSRNYRYEHVFRYVTAVSSSGVRSYAIAALVTNKQIAPMSNGSLSPASGDSPGGSIVLLDAGFRSDILTALENGSTNPPINETASATFGTVLSVLSNFRISVSGNLKSFAAKNPRYLSSYTPDSATMASGYDGHDELLYCDDNGAFDLDPVWAPAASTPVTLAYASVNWWLGASDYHGLTAPIDATSSAFNRGNIPFVPTSLQRVGTDSQTVSGTTTYGGRYLIANPYSQGSVSSVFGSPGAPGFGGEVFLYAALSKQIVTNRTFSRPSNTSPLSQPTCAVLAK